MSEPAPPWSRLRPLPVLFVIGLFVALWWRQPRKPTPETPAAPSADSALPAGETAERGPRPAGLRAVRTEEREGEPVFVAAGDVMGTRWNLTVLGERITDDRAEDVARAVQSALDAVDAAMSTYKPDSAVSRFNAAGAGVPVAIGEETAAVVAAAIELGELSDGAFDVTVAPLVRAWGFGADAADEAPDNDALAALRERVGVRHLTLDREAATLSKDRADVTIDLSAVAKGHGVDRAAAAVRAAGYTRFLVEVGGEVVVAGTGPGRRHWRLGIERPDAPPGTVHDAVPMRDRALATSGDYRNVRKLGEKRISHTIDPRTGRPVEHALASVSVLADDCRTADGLATALSVLGPEDGMRLCREQKLAAYFLVRREDGSFDGRACPAWQPTIDAMQQDR